MVQIKLRSLCISLVLGSLIALSSFSVASAQADHPPAPPVVTDPVHFEGSQEIWDCGSFEIIDYFVADVSAIRFIDEASNLWRVILQAQGTDTFTNSETGKAYTGSYHNTLIISPRMPGTGAVEAGVTFRLTVPGAGAVVLDVGVLLSVKSIGVDIFGGPHQVIEGDLAGLCAALA